MHLKRLLTAAIAIPLLYLAIMLLPPVVFLVVLAAVSTLALAEFYAMYKTKRPLALAGILFSVLFFCTAYFLAADGQGVADTRLIVYPTLIIVSFVSIATLRLFLVRDPASSLADVAPVLVGLWYIPPLLLPQWQLRLLGPEWIILLYGAVWASDSLAYYVGKGMGKRKLYPEMSPKKTVAGAVGSVIGGGLAALLIGSILFKGTGPAGLGLVGFLIGGVTIIGDLVESMFKRDAGVKDSSAIIPGHGGFLDKIDSVLFAGPLLYWYSSLV